MSSPRKKLSSTLRLRRITTCAPRPRAAPEIVPEHPESTESAPVSCTIPCSNNVRHLLVSPRKGLQPPRIAHPQAARTGERQLARPEKTETTTHDTIIIWALLALVRIEKKYP